MDAELVGHADLFLGAGRARASAAIDFAVHFSQIEKVGKPVERGEPLPVESCLQRSRGNDPTFHGTDHTREEVPLFVLHRGETRDLGIWETFADVAATLVDLFRLPQRWPTGGSFLAPCTSRV